jgi:curved DNA-binding protein CbpA
MGYYEILGLRRDASVEEIQQAYRALARKVHPDLHTGDGTRAEDRMKQLNEIRETLSDPLLRSAHDAQMRREDEERARRAAPPEPASGDVRGVPEPSAGVPNDPFFTPPGRRTSGHRRAPRPAMALLLVAILCAMGAALLGRSRFLADWPAPKAPVSTAGEAEPNRATRPKGLASTDLPRTPTQTSRAPESRPGKKGVVKIGSTVAEVMRLLGQPDRTEPGTRPGNVFLVYGQLRLELRNGAVVGGGQ